MKSVLFFCCVLIQFCYAQDANPVFYPVYMNGKMGYMDKNGKLRIKCELATEDWYELTNKTEDIFAAKNDGSYYLVKKDGSLVSNTPYKNLYFDTKNKLIRADLDNNKTDILASSEVVWLNYKGEKIIADKFKCGIFECSYHFDNNLWVFTKNQKQGAINLKGEIIIEPKYKELTDFKNGYASFRSFENDKKGIISQNNKIIINAKYDEISNVSDDGYFFAIKITPTGKQAVVVNLKGKEIKNLGKLKINYLYTTFAVFDNNVALVQDSVTKLFGVVDRKGNLITSPKYAGVYSIYNENTFVFNVNGTKSENDAWFERTGGNWVFVNGLTGKEIGTPFSANKVKAMQNGLAAYNVNNKWGFISNDGKIAMEPKFEETPDGFDNELCRLIIKSKSFRELSSIGYINKKGEYVWKVQK